MKKVFRMVGLLLGVPLLLIGLYSAIATTIFVFNSSQSKGTIESIDASSGQMIANVRVEGFKDSFPVATTTARRSGDIVDVRMTTGSPVDVRFADFVNLWGLPGVCVLAALALLGLLTGAPLAASAGESMFDGEKHHGHHSDGGPEISSGD